MDGSRRLIRSFLPSRTSSTTHDSRPTTIVSGGAPTRPDYDASIPYPDNPYPQHHQSTMQSGGLMSSPSDPRPRAKPELVEANDQLAVYRTLVGIDNSPGLTTGFYSSRTAENIGIYGRVVAAEKIARKKYQIFSTLINFCLGLQLVVAAALTALGAGNGPHKLVTALGGINTVIAGLMTYLKGSGLPHKLKYYENEWTKCREFIEQREREFCREGCMLNVEEQVNMVVDMYENIKGDIELNTNDSVMSASSMQKKLEAQKPRPAMSRAPTHGQTGPTYITPASTGQYAAPHYPAYPERAMSPGKEKEKEGGHMV